MRNNNTCEICGGRLRKYDKVKRNIILENRKKISVKVRRKQCVECHRIFRMLGSNLVPYKHYHASIYEGVVKGYITPDNVYYEDFPSEKTMKRWIKEYKDNKPS